MIETTPKAIKKRPLRNPGQALEEQLIDVLIGKALPWYTGAVFAAFLTHNEWTRWAISDSFRPVFFTVVGIIVIPIAAWKIRKAIATAKNLKTGLLGERYIGQYLQNSLLRNGYWVVHDIIDDAGNIDHVVIGPGGVFSVETKTRTKRKGENKVTYDGTKVLVNGLAPDRDPVVQAKAAAGSLQRILRDYTGTTVEIRPVVLFPEWYVESQPRGVETWVLNEKAFVKFVENEPERLSKEDVFRLAAALGRYVRDQEEKRK